MTQEPTPTPKPAPKPQPKPDDEPPPRPPPVVGYAARIARRFWIREMRNWVMVAAAVVTAWALVTSTQVSMLAHVELLKIAERQEARYAKQAADHDKRARASDARENIVMGSVKDWAEVSEEMQKQIPGLETCKKALEALAGK